MHHYSQQIDEVRKMAESHARRCEVNPEAMKESFLFAGDRFAGVRFLAENVEVRWLFGNELVELRRDGSVVAKVQIEGMQQPALINPRRAA